MTSFVTASGFDWDAANHAHCRKHGMEPREIESVFRIAPRVAPDWKHSANEARFLAVGRTEQGRLAFVVFTMRADRIRPLSARYMHAKEAARYDKAQGS